MLATPCIPRCSSVPQIVEVPGATGINGDDGPQGEEGPPGPEASLIHYEAYGDSSTAVYELASSSAHPASQLLNLTPTAPSIVIVEAGDYVLRARIKANGAAVTLTTQVLTVKLRCVNNTVGDVTNSERTFEFIPSTTITGTLADITLPDVIYTATAGDNIEIWGSVSANTGAGEINCIEADLFALKVAPAA